jgi:uncharacterized protein (TIGR02246 family)
MQRLFFFIATATLMLTASAFVLASGQQEGTNKSKSDNKREAKIVAAVRAVLDAQVAAWNRGDLEGFMDGYARSSDITFVSGDSLTRGWQTVLDRYKKGYDSRAKMGTLAFSELEIKVVGNDAAVVLGRFQLTRERDAPAGRFTLIFRRMREGWRIVHDHTSSAS